MGVRPCRETLSIPNSVDLMLNNLETGYEGPQCTPNAYAYVFPGAYTCILKFFIASHTTACPWVWWRQLRYAFHHARLTGRCHPRLVVREASPTLGGGSLPRRLPWVGWGPH